MNNSEKKRRSLLMGAAIVSVGGWLPSATRAQDWPSRPIHILVGYPPGGTADNYARLIAAHYQAKLGQNVIVENRPGGVGMIAMAALAKSPPDGYTLALSPTSVYWGNRAFYKNMPFDPDADVQPFSLLPAGPTIMAVPASTNITNYKDFISWAKQNPASAGTYAQGSTAHIMIDAINRSEGTKIVPIHYKGEAPMWVDTASGVLSAGFGTYTSFAPLFEKGLLTPIAVGTTTRSPKLPDTPTLVEQGLTARVFSLDPWTSMVAPAKTPEAILTRLAELTRDFADSPRGVIFREQYGIAQKPTLYQETLARAKSEAPVWIEMAKQLGIEPQ